MSNDDNAKAGRRGWMGMISRPTSANSTRPVAMARTGSSSSTQNGALSKLGLGTRSNQSSVVNLATPKEGEELDISNPSSKASTPAPEAPAAVSSSRPSLSRPSSIIRNLSFDSPPNSVPGTPKRHNQASQIIINALERTSSQQTHKSNADSQRNLFGKSLSNMLSLSRTNTKEDDRGRSLFSTRRSSGKSASQAPPEKQAASRSQSRARSSSPFSLRKWRSRGNDSSPPPQPVPLGHSDVEYSEAESTVQSRSAFMDGEDTDNVDDDTSDGDSDDDSLSDEDFFDPVTERNTEQNAIIAPIAAEPLPEVEDPDPVGEGVNVVVPLEPYFPTTLNSTGARGKRNPRRRKTMRTHEPLPLNTSRPVFQRDRCTITITQGDPEAKLTELDRKRRRYVVASDLSDESRYAVEWGIGTVLRDGDEMLLVNVMENEAKDRSTKLRNQQERQGMAYILARQVTGLLQRTRLNVTIACQAWHAKNARHMLLDIVDHVEPTMLIVGSRGLSHLNGILLGSTSHYLIEKCSVPVMVARRRLKRPPKKAAHLSTSRRRVKLAEAGIDRIAGKVEEDVHAMRDELQKEEKRRDGGPGSVDRMPDFSSAAEFNGNDDDDDAAEGDNEDDEEPPTIEVRGPKQ
ncbi:hypothetical protein CC1G_03455 [Coprinopsis cinerea okayama7|uniref:UspA domain-containing protein n=1 Tax=Coprinopsis cinerea (strain Okayama-7 / 130 / ATCC MYA-4618 / FGSC 9003) TaxID=240176 RepID=A8NQS9_COPC7|nr:hypothetical protein CC1G_03455 [Coprinopsis cinerea okayama7\|eukprot:XP_001835673.2 hypothetical protein CC1G_03455 [Coprinopsis cinerea okayama7\